MAINVYGRKRPKQKKPLNHGVAGTLCNVNAKVCRFIAKNKITPLRDEQIFVVENLMLITMNVINDY